MCRMDPCPHRRRRRLHDLVLAAFLAVGAFGVFVHDAYEPYRDLVHVGLFSVAVTFFSLLTTRKVNHWFGYDLHGPRTDERDHLLALYANTHTLRILSYVVAVQFIALSAIKNLDMALSSLVVLWLAINWMPKFIKDYLNTRM